MTISSHPVEIIEQLKSIVGKNNYIDDASKMDSFLNDWRLGTATLTNSGLTEIPIRLPLLRWDLIAPTSGCSTR